MKIAWTQNIAIEILSSVYVNFILFLVILCCVFITYFQMYPEVEFGKKYFAVLHNRKIRLPLKTIHFRNNGRCYVVFHVNVKFHMQRITTVICHYKSFTQMLLLFKILHNRKISLPLLTIHFRNNRNC